MSNTLPADFITKLKTDYNSGNGSIYQCYQDVYSYISSNQNTLGLDAGTLFWYQQAVQINDPDNSSFSLSRDFIRSETAYGERLDGKTPDDNGQAVSDDIGRHVIGSIIDSASILSLPQLLGQDISVAISDFGLTIGGWGGSFYYWTSAPQYSNGTTGSTPGDQISAALVSGTDFDKGGQFDKFLAANAAAANDTRPVDFSHGVTGFLADLKNIGQTAYNASAPLSVKEDLFSRMYDIASGAPIVGSPDVIDGNIYDEGTGKWSSVTTSTTELGANLIANAPTLSAGDLSAERQYRTAHSTIFGGSNAPQSDTSDGGLQLGYSVGAHVNDDESYSFITYQQASVTDGLGAILSNNIYNPSGGIVESISGATGPNQYGSYTSGGDVWSADGSNIVASELLSATTPDTNQTPELVAFTPVSGDWSRDQMNFLGGSNTISSITLDKTDGTSLILYLPNEGSQAWSASFYSSAGSVDKTISYGAAYDPQTQQETMGTTTYENGSSSTVLGVSDVNPISFLPADAPGSFQAAANLWSNDIAAAMNGTSSTTVASAVASSASLGQTMVAALTTHVSNANLLT
ncbi:hypothetical protein J2D73_10170 [Acetobacter sacchari]|uniref:Uncharacterized protein n=1 Tax=Acetobacter sacchari TaxID=2661687 RepID=A0ABS3LW59_9PROT|nr:hypothetical protein [Acetobacter sacchari]MBO1360163.1 hypothetical protein [Acetobacter sacchari]